MSNPFLTSKDLQEIDYWIQRIKQNKYKPKEKKKKKAQIKLDLDYKLLASGHHRAVFDLDNGWILKVATSCEGMKENEKEIKVYEEMPLSMRKHLAKIKDFGEGWIVMKKVKRNMKKTAATIKKVRKLHRKFEKKGIRARDILTKNKRIPKWQNIGVQKGGEILIIDYGAFRLK